MIDVGGECIRGCFWRHRIRFLAINRNITRNSAGIGAGCDSFDAGIRSAVRITTRNGRGHIHCIILLRNYPGRPSAQRTDRNRLVAPRKRTGRKPLCHARHRNICRPIYSKRCIKRRRKCVGKRIRWIGIIRSSHSTTRFRIDGQCCPEGVWVTPRIT